MSNISFESHIPKSAISTVKMLLLWVLFLTLACYILTVITYRLFLSPLSRIPGPRLAGLTSNYMGYYDVYQRGQYIWIIEKMHEQYGSIVRISPHVIHINDPKYIEELFSGPGKEREKWRTFARMTGLPDTAFATIGHNLHRHRRAAISPHFSRTSLEQLEPVIHKKLADFRLRLSAYRDSGKPANLSKMFKALAGDIVSEYAFGECNHDLLRDDFNADYFETIQRFLNRAHLFAHIGWLNALIQALPQKLVLLAVPSIHALVKLQNVRFHSPPAFVDKLT
jgi:cytochrome P450